MEEKDQPASLNRRRIFLVATFLIVIIIISFTLLGLYLRQVLVASGLSFQEVRQKISLARQKRPRFKKRVNFLILGLDQRNDKLEHTLLTDTIIFASLNPQKGELKLVSIPRDLWLDHLKTKINAVYYYGEIDEETTGSEFLTKELSAILNQPIDYDLVLDYQNLSQLIDLLGGIDVYLEEGFTDPEYPNPAYVAATDSGVPKYLTVSFKAGPNHLNGERALEFVRSRTSTNLNQGNDLARSARQLLLVKGVLAKLRTRDVVFNPQRIGNLYHFWQEKIMTSLKDEDLIAILMEIFPRCQVVLRQTNIPATYEPEGALLVHPPIKKYRQWVWEPQSGDWTKLQEFVNDFLNQS